MLRGSPKLADVVILSPRVRGMDIGVYSYHSLALPMVLRPDPYLWVHQKLRERTIPDCGLICGWGASGARSLSGTWSFIPLSVLVVRIWRALRLVARL